MNTKQKLISLAGTLIVVTLLSASAVSAATAACGLGACALPAYLCALGGALLCALISFSPRAGVPAALVAVAGVGTYVALNISGGSIARLVSSIGEVRAGGGAAALISSGPLIAGAAAAILSIFIYVLISDRSSVTTVVAVALCLGVAVACSAAGGAFGVWQLAPGALGACLAFSHTAEQRRNGGHIKAMIPAALAVTLAAALIPAAGVTFAPLEEAAEKVRQLYEDYFSYTQERVAFSISEQGYDYYGLKNDEPTHLLGGPANPDGEAVMQVVTDDNILMRGTARGEYTGYSWEDTSAKSRNLYYDFTRRSRRSAVFGLELLEDMDTDSAFIQVEAEVTMLDEGSSTLFAPARLTGLDMSLTNALYYNSVGELFLARNVEKGDGYSFTGLEPASPAAITALAAARGDVDDNGYKAAVRDYTALPGCVEDDVYQIAALFTDGLSTDAEKAQAILEGLRANCAYTLDVSYPPQDRDFVSYFLLDSKEGYCSYFASAMAVLCRAEGIPARYVEGYRVYAEADGVTLVTGQDAHAWVEVYIKGVGWVAYDPTPGGEDHDQQQGDTPDTEPTPSPTPTPEPTLPPESTPTPEPDTDQSEPTPTPTPEPTPEPSSEPSPTPEPTSQSESPPENDPPDDDNGKKWLWIALIILIVLLIVALLVYLMKKRLESTDPIRLIARQKNDNRAVLILYRSILTLLMQLGQAPLSGETPETFAERLCRTGLNNPDFLEFARGVMLTRYSRTPAGRELTSLGARAYLRFRQQMKRSECIRFDIHRALHGLGSFDVIP